MSDYMDPSRYEPAIGPMEDEFCGMLDDYDPADSAAHDRLVAFVAHMEMKLATSNNQLEYIEGIATAEGKTMQQRLTAIEDCFRRDAPTKAFTPPSAARLQALEKVYQKASELIAFIGHNGEAYSTHGQVEDLTCALDDCDRASVTKGAAPPTDDAKQLLREAAPYIESFAQLTKHPTAPADARVLIDRIYAYTNARGAPTKSACCRQSPCLHPGVGPCDKELNIAYLEELGCVAGRAANGHANISREHLLLVVAEIKRLKQRIWALDLDVTHRSNTCAGLQRENERLHAEQELPPSKDLLAEAAKFIDGFAASGEAGFARQRKALDWMMRYRSYCMLPTAHEPAAVPLLVPRFDCTPRGVERSEQGKFVDYSTFQVVSDSHGWLYREKQRLESALARAAQPPVPVVHGVVYDRGGWICSICHGWNCLKEKHCQHVHSGSAATKGGEQS